MPQTSANSMNIEAEKENKKQKLLVILTNSEINEVLSQKQNRLPSVQSGSKNINLLKPGIK